MRQLGAWGMGCIAVGLGISPSLTSIGVALVAISSLWHKESLASLRDTLHLHWPIATLYLLQALSWFYTEDNAQWWVEMRVKLPMLFLLPFSYAAWRELATSAQRWIHLLYHLTLIAVGMHAWVWSLLHPQEMAWLTYSGKYVRFIGGISHIYYAGLIGMGFFLLWLLPLPAYERTIRWVIALLYSVILHGLALRTGLIALYGVVIFFLLGWMLKHPKRWIIGLLVIAGGIGGLAWGVHCLKPLRNRWNHMRWDLHQYKPGRYISHTSLTRRLAALEASWYVFRSSPWWGIGIADNQKAVFAVIPKLPYHWEKQHYILPHNQFVEYALGLGLIGIGVFTSFWVGAWRSSRWIIWRGWLVFWLLLLQGEAFLERQVGVTAFLWGTGILWALLKEEPL
ncbi:MAG: O-antigen ligase family protein [Bacteroidia bacterium]|nr:O-antigen ligase family protein [Bacteroidia bacterium]MDW8235860.1 O-antigen ligase family protein [Bacteroidia bacterium]